MLGLNMENLEDDFHYRHRGRNLNKKKTSGHGRQKLKWELLLQKTDELDSSNLSGLRFKRNLQKANGNSAKD